MLKLIRLLGPVALTVLLLSIPLFQVILPELERNLWQRKREVIHQATNLALSLISRIHQETPDPELARAKAMNAIKALRYGANGRDYFWIMSLDSRMVMHPLRPDLDGQFIGNYIDPRGNRLFQEMTEVVQNHGSGWVEYHWQWHDSPTVIVPKISFVKPFRPWGWIIGTGMYLGDVSQEIDIFTARFKNSCFLILGLITLVCTGMALQSSKAEARRRLAEQRLTRHRNRLETLVEKRTSQIKEHRARLEEDVSRRTQALRRNNELLCKEINQREMVSRALKESEVKLASILHKLPTGVAIIDAENHRVVDANPAMLELLEMTKDEVVGQKCFSHICPHSQGICPITDLGQQVDQRETFIVNRNGEEMPVLATAIPLVLDGRQHLLESYTNMSHHKLAEDRLKEHVQQLSDAKRRLELMVSNTTEREKRMVDLKEEVNHLLRELGQMPRYLAPEQVHQFTKRNDCQRETVKQ